MSYRGMRCAYKKWMVALWDWQESTDIRWAAFPEQTNVAHFVIALLKEVPHITCNKPGLEFCHCPTQNLFRGKNMI